MDERDSSAEAPGVPAPEKTGEKRNFLKALAAKKKRAVKNSRFILVVVIAIVAGCVRRLTKKRHTQLGSSYLVSNCHLAGSDGQRSW